MAKTSRSKGRKPGDLILLKDLAPRKDPKGGSGGKAVFGEQVPFPVGPPGGSSVEPAPAPRAKRNRDERPKNEGG